jgi:hypothetical protein
MGAGLRSGTLGSATPADSSAINSLADVLHGLFQIYLLTSDSHEDESHRPKAGSSLIQDHGILAGVYYCYS